MHTVLFTFLEGVDSRRMSFFPRGSRSIQVELSSHRGGAGPHSGICRFPSSRMRHGK